jgi:hypothetical protein
MYQVKTVSLLILRYPSLIIFLLFSVHEHMWLTGGYGIWGKEEYLKRYWSVVNWDKVSRILELWTPNSVRDPAAVNQFGQARGTLGVVGRDMRLR